MEGVGQVRIDDDYWQQVQAGGLRVPEDRPLDELTAAGMLAPSVLRGAGYEPADVLAACAAAAESLV